MSLEDFGLVLPGAGAPVERRFYQREWIRTVDRWQTESSELSTMLRAVLRVISPEELEAATRIAEDAGVTFVKE